MQTVFRDEVLQILNMNLGNIIVFSQDIPEHLRRLEIVLKKLCEHGPKLEPKKYQFFCPNVNYLGHVVSADGVTTDPDKTEAQAKYSDASEVLPGLCLILPLICPTFFSMSKTAAQAVVKAI